MTAAHDPGPRPATSSSFRPGPGFLLLVIAALAVLVLALAAAICAALGARSTSLVLGGAALVIVGVGMLAVLRVPARSVVVNAPRLRLERVRARAARRAPTAAQQTPAPLKVPGTDLVVPDSSGHRELTTLDVVSGPVTTALAASELGRMADDRLAGTSVGEGIIRVAQLLAGALGFTLVALGLASILGQVLS
ncbi:MAG: hypothetical protein Q4C85_10190 [Actinomyces sp.]|uniref:hypothetical protein n=1 Tax=Actinomyces sp. TaxID=29317 RepID=UPI0026DABA90|nr:hypothetical protein [Actinomyces sp.]MDO4244106.1 hypothetical protein [Actinomyces sp.]